MNVPSGNLYKFMALFGLLLFFTCVLLPYVKFEDNVDRINDVRRKLLVLTHEREALVNEIKLYEDQKSIDGGGAELTMLGKRIYDTKNGVDLRTEQIGLENEILEELVSTQDKIRVFVVVSAIASLLITLFGFLLWYTRVQRPLNRVIRLNLVKEASSTDDE